MLKLSPLVVAVLLSVVKESCAATSEDLIIAKGEQREIGLEKLKNYSVGNKDVLTTRLLGTKLLIKGRQVGFSDLVIWDKNGKKQLQVYVLSKTSFLKTTQLAETLKDLGLTLNLKGPLMVVDGEVKTLEDWRYLQLLKTQHKDRVVFHVEAIAELKRLIVTDVYRDLFDASITRVSCRTRYLDMECTHESGVRGKEIMEALSARWGVKFISRESRWARGNLKLKLKLIQIESMNGQEISFGLSALRAKPLDLFDQGLKKLISDNQIVLAENNIDMSTLAEPETLVRLEKPHVIEVGAQIPFQNISQGQGVVMAPIDWRFAGLKITTLVSERDGHLALDYETEFTRPSNGAISGSKEKSSVIVKPGMVYKLFHIGYKSSGEDRKHLPGLKDVPLLRVLFGSRGKQSTYKRIEGYLIIEEEN
ncbi:MAG: type II and III secretion system protein [Bacteriovoracaceae bacterium]|nr:type II and III secretion system protein [Bacteriovoracaceae bacterium]